MRKFGHFVLRRAMRWRLDRPMMDATSGMYAVNAPRDADSRRAVHGRRTRGRRAHTPRRRGNTSRGGRGRHARASKRRVEAPGQESRHARAHGRRGHPPWRPGTKGTSRLSRADAFAVITEALHRTRMTTPRRIRSRQGTPTRPNRRRFRNASSHLRPEGVNACARPRTLIRAVPQLAVGASSGPGSAGGGAGSARPVKSCIRCRKSSGETSPLA